MNLSLSQARVIDPVLTTHVQGFKHPKRVGKVLFPGVPVDTQAGKVIEFGKESFMLYNAKRAPGANTGRIDFGYLGRPYELDQDALESKVPREIAREADKVPKIDLGMRATDVVMKTLTLALEYEQAQLATNTDSYKPSNKVALAGTDQWTDKNASDPIANVETAREAVRSAIGFYPNVGVIGPKPYSAAKQHPKIVERFKFTSSESITVQMLASLFELERLEIGEAVVADDAGVFSDVWGNSLVLAYAPQEPSGMEEPSFGYTYELEGHPFAERPYYEGPVKSWIYGVTYERSPEITGIDAGYLIDNIAA